MHVDVIRKIGLSSSHLIGFFRIWIVGIENAFKMIHKLKNKLDYIGNQFNYKGVTNLTGVKYVTRQFSIIARCWSWNNK